MPEVYEWSTTRPVVPGHYWLRGPNLPARVVELRPSNRGLVAAWPGRWFLDPIRGRDYDDVEWHGPIEPPPF